MYGSSVARWETDTPPQRGGCVGLAPRAEVSGVEAAYARSHARSASRSSRCVSDVGEQPGQRVAQRQGLAASFFRCQHIVDQGAAIQDALPAAVGGYRPPGAQWRQDQAERSLKGDRARK